MNQPHGAAGNCYRAGVCVYGASPGGVTAAIAARREGADVILAAPGSGVGGILANGLGANDLDNHGFTNSAALGGMAREFYARMAAHYGHSGLAFRFEPKAATAVFEAWLAEAGVRVVRGFRLAGAADAVTRVDGRITGIRAADGSRIGARMFVDGTVEGDLMAASGVSYTWGREGNAAYGESLNGIRTTNTYRQFAVDVDPYVVPGDPGSGVIAGIQDEPLGHNGDPDRRVMAYCFRICLTNQPANRIPVSRPAGYRAEDYEIHLRYFAAGGAGSFFFPEANLPGFKTDLGSWHDLSANLYGLNHGYPDGTDAERERIYNQHRDHTLGLIWFLQNDPRVPARVRERWTGWGLPADEFADNGHWPRELYVRSARRMVSDYVITQADLTPGNPDVADPVAVAYWPPDLHHCRRIIRDGRAYNEGFVFNDNLGRVSWRPFGVSYRALVPRRAECRNLLAPITPSSSYVAYGAIRLEWTFMSLGEAAGRAAACAAFDAIDVQDVAYTQLAARLRAGGAVLSLEPIPST